MIYKRRKVKWGLSLLIMVITVSCTAQDTTPGDVRAKEIATKDPNVWVFLMCGQSNMAGRGAVEPRDRETQDRIITINKEGQWVPAKEPLHFYEPNYAGLDCGMSFAERLLEEVPDSVTIALVPCAVGGSSVFQWLGDEEHRGVALLSNFYQKVALAQKKGTIKGILWHQGESNANARDLPVYPNALETLFARFRTAVKNDSLPIVMGELGRFAQPEEKAAYFEDMNTLLGTIAEKDDRLFLVSSEGLDYRGDHLHFNSASQRELGKRYAETMIKQLTTE